MKINCSERSVLQNVTKKMQKFIVTKLLTTKLSIWKINRFTVTYTSVEQIRRVFEDNLGIIFVI